METPSSSMTLKIPSFWTTIVKQTLIIRGIDVFVQMDNRIGPYVALRMAIPRRSNWDAKTIAVTNSWTAVYTLGNTRYVLLTSSLWTFYEYGDKFDWTSTDG